MATSQKDNKLQTQVNQDKKEQDEQPMLMWKKKTDKKGKQVWEMIPPYCYYFSQFLQVIQKLSKTVYKKWNKQQVDSYHEFLQAVKNYIENYILTALVMDYNLFYQALNQYAENTNPVGKKLFEHQLDYLLKKQIGYDFSLDKKLKKYKNKSNNSQNQGKINFYFDKQGLQKQMRKINIVQQSSDSQEDEYIKRSFSKMELRKLVDNGFTRVERRKKQDKR